MPELPAVPPEVVRLTQFIDVAGLQVSIGFWLLNANNASMDGVDAEHLLAAYFATCMPPLLGLMHNGASFTTCRLDSFGLRAEGNAPPNLGAWTGGTESAVASGLKWTTQLGGRRSWSITYVPACPANFVINHWQLSQTGFGTLRAQGLELLAALGNLPAPLGGVQEPGTLRRKSAAGPLPVSLWAGYTDVFPVTKLCTVSRRIPARGHLSPTP